METMLRRQKSEKPFQKENKKGNKRQKGRSKAHQLYFPDTKFKYLEFFLKKNHKMLLLISN